MLLISRNINQANSNSEILVYILPENSTNVLLGNNYATGKGVPMSNIVCKSGFVKGLETSRTLLSTSRANGTTSSIHKRAKETSVKLKQPISTVRIPDPIVPEVPNSLLEELRRELIESQETIASLKTTIRAQGKRIDALEEKNQRMISLIDLHGTASK
ncbi:hypothetical protein PENTCL1PPCAC_12419 [Pristionchus entomophagus]|uniref:Uncharacterized protein n=1 Tax=Pristionchus entomophagus TaxID=358040 RepID=A0AAV5T4P1_9BILA|nr:hypothetical protein PENTCL1PPCAC_12419 [Pristionchus entomophagus]